jgi:hypothetical protein
LWLNLAQQQSAAIAVVIRDIPPWTRPLNPDEWNQAASNDADKSL